jgi:hypothetical protein
MSAANLAVQFKVLREQPHWKLLAATNGPTILALFRTIFGPEPKRLGASILLERLRRELEDLILGGNFTLDQTPQRYLSAWVGDGWLARRLLPGSSEEEYELTAEALGVLRHVEELHHPRNTATESRLATVFHRAQVLAEKTDPDPVRRVQSLDLQIRDLEAQRDRLLRGDLPELDPQLALESLKDLLSLVADLPQDFRRVRGEFERLNAALRYSLVHQEGSRAEVLQALFDGADLIAESPAGRTFAAFWEYLMDQGAQARFSEAVGQLLTREFAKELDRRDLRALEGLLSRLLQEAEEVQGTHRQMSQSLRSFVRTRQFRENRLVTDRIRSATQAALTLRDHIRPSSHLDFSLTLTTASLKSVTQLTLRDPSGRAVLGPLELAEVDLLDWQTVEALAGQADIDFRALKTCIREALGTQSQVSVAQLVERFGAPQGLATLVGYLVLGSESGVQGLTEGGGLVSWETDRVEGGRWTVQGRVPSVYFVQGWEDGLGN